LLLQKQQNVFLPHQNVMNSPSLQSEIDTFCDL
jgi:hypothetical protein